jgi:hypothetical protein
MGVLCQPNGKHKLAQQDCKPFLLPSKQTPSQRQTIGSKYLVDKMATKNYEHKMMTAPRSISPTYQTWDTENDGVPVGTIGVYGCCQPRCGRVNYLVLFNGEYLFKHLRCDCDHVMCEHCCTDVLKFDTDRQLRADPVKVPIFGTESPYFSVCKDCGLTCRATASSTTGILKSPKMALTFKLWGTPCDFCGCTVDSQWARVSLVASQFGVPEPGLHRRDSLLRVATLNARDIAHRKSGLLKPLTGSIRAAANLVARSTASQERGETSLTPPVLDTQNLPGAARARRGMDRDHNVPYDWEVVEYDGECYTYRDGEGNLHRTSPGNRYGPFIHL